MIPFVHLGAQYNAYREEFDTAIATVLKSGNLIGGPEVHQFEENLAKDTGVKQVISCASGTSALRLALRALGLRPGDEVIVPDYTFVATAEAVALEGGIPRFADIGEDFLISPSATKKRITEKTVGIIVVDLFGQCADYENLQKIADTCGLWILEDAAQSIGATKNGKAAGSFGNIAATSFYPTKPFGSLGDGGAVLTNDDELAQKVRIFANHGLCNNRYMELGSNSRLDEIQAAVLNVKRKHLPEELNRRQKNAQIYNDFFRETEVRTPPIATGNTSIFAQYTLCSENRDHWIQKFTAADIPTRIYYSSPLSAEPCFSRYSTTAEDSKQNRISHKLSKESFCLPICAFTNANEILEALCRI